MSLREQAFVKTPATLSSHFPKTEKANPNPVAFLGSHGVLHMKKELKCPHAEFKQQIILCDQAPEVTGAPTVWKARDSKKIIVTDYWCFNKCKWYQEEQKPE